MWSENGSLTMGHQVGLLKVRELHPKIAAASICKESQIILLPKRFSGDCQ